MGFQEGDTSGGDQFRADFCNRGREMDGKRARGGFRKSTVLVVGRIPAPKNGRKRGGGRF